MAMGSVLAGNLEDNDTRKSMMNLISSGEMSVGELELFLGVSDSTIRYHMDQLVHEGKAKVEIYNGKQFLGLPIRYPVLIDNKTRQDIVTILNKSETVLDGVTYKGILKSKLDKKLEIGRNSINYHIRKLNDELIMAPSVNLGRSTLLSLNGDYTIVNNGYVFKDNMHYYGKNV